MTAPMPAPDPERSVEDILPELRATLVPLIAAMKGLSALLNQLAHATEETSRVYQQVTAEVERLTETVTYSAGRSDKPAHG